MIRLLFDHNLSPKLKYRLSDVFPESGHVVDFELDRASDREIWEFARSHVYTVVTRDADFGEFSVVWGAPPKVIWIRRGNCSTKDVEMILRGNRGLIAEFGDDESARILLLY